MTKCPYDCIKYLRYKICKQQKQQKVVTNEHAKLYDKGAGSDC